MSGKCVGKLNMREEQRKEAVIHMLRLAGTLIQMAMFSGMWYLCFLKIGPARLEQIRLWGMTITYLVLYILMAKIYDGMEVNSKGALEITYAMGMAQLFTLILQYLLAGLMVGQLLNLIPFLVLFGCDLLVTAAIAHVAVHLHRKLFPPMTAFVIYDYLDPDDFLQEISHLSWKFQVVDVLSLKQGMENILGGLDQVEAVVLYGVHSSDRNTILKTCVNSGVQMYFKPKIGDLLLNNASRIQLLNVPVLHCGRNKTTLTYEFLKRTMDILLSGIALLVLSPLMAVVAVVIHTYDHGPAFYRQIRLTRDGKKFEILKFRSMRVDAEEDGVARLAIEGDSRITPVGRFIRACRIDELPQLINILRGEMSIVGPRPERPEIAAQYEEEMPEFSLRLQVKAGLTGYAQVYGKYNTRPYDKLQMDLLYIAEQSVWQDIKLIFVTVKVLFMKESTQGVEHGQLTAKEGRQSIMEQKRAG